MKKKIIGITGATGVLGAYFIKKYKNYEYDIFEGDITNLKDVKLWIQNTNAKYILHFASKVSTKYVKKNYQKALEVNYLGTKNLVRNICKYKKDIWLFFASSSHVYKSSNRILKEIDEVRPITLYGRTKLRAENYLLKDHLKNKLKICIGRIFSFTNKKQKKPYLIPSLHEKINKQRDSINIDNLNHVRDFCHIEDICRAINLLKKKKLSGTFNIGTGKGTNLLNIIKLINIKNKKITSKKNLKKTFLVANISKIKKIGFKPRYGIKKIIKDMHYK